MADLVGEYREVSRLIDSGDFDGALSRLDALLAGNPEDMMLWLLKGMAFKAKGEGDSAVNAFVQASIVEPSSPWPYLRLAETLREGGRLNDAFNEAVSGVSLNPGRFELWQEMGLILEEMLMPRQALECFGRALTLNGSAAWSWLGRARALSYLDAADQALEACDRALSIEPDEPAFREYRDYLKRKLGG